MDVSVEKSAYKFHTKLFCVPLSHSLPLSIYRAIWSVWCSVAFFCLSFTIHVLGAYINFYLVNVNSIPSTATIHTCSRRQQHKLLPTHIYHSNYRNRKFLLSCMRWLRFGTVCALFFRSLNGHNCAVCIVTTTTTTTTATTTCTGIVTAVIALPCQLKLLCKIERVHFNGMESNEIAKEPQFAVYNTTNSSLSCERV